MVRRFATRREVVPNNLPQNFGHIFINLFAGKDVSRFHDDGQQERHTER